MIKNIIAFNLAIDKRVDKVHASHGMEKGKRKDVKDKAPMNKRSQDTNNRTR